MIFECLFQHKIHEKTIYIATKGTGFKKDSHQFPVFCLLSLAFSLSSFQAILYCPVIWATDARSFYPFIPPSWKICSKYGKPAGSQARSALRDLKERGNFGLWDHKSLPLATRQGGERTQWKEMLCLLPAALPSAAEGGGCVTVCSPPLTTKDLFKMHARRRIRAEPSLLSFVQGEEGSIALGYWVWALLLLTAYFSLPSSYSLPSLLKRIAWYSKNDIVLYRSISFQPAP